MTTRLSTYVTVAEFEFSIKAIRNGWKNKMGAIETARARELAVNVLDVIRAHYDAGINISSGYRSKVVNDDVGSHDGSQHRKGEAADFTITGVSNQQVFDDIRHGRIKGLQYDQLIFEGGWIHISYHRERLRRENLIATFTKKGVTYRKAA